MEATQVARRYAGGLFALTEEQQVSEDVHNDFTALADLLRQDKLLLQFLAAPQLLDSDKHAVVQKVFEDKVIEQLYALLQLLVDKHRTSYLLEIAEEYDRLYNESRGFVSTKLITAVSLTEGEVARIKEQLDRLTGRKVVVETEVDPTIIGGVVAIVGDRIIDRSVRHGLDVLREQLMELKVH